MVASITQLMGCTRRRSNGPNEVKGKSGEAGRVSGRPRGGLGRHHPARGTVRLVWHGGGFPRPPAGRPHRLQGQRRHVAAGARRGGRAAIPVCLPLVAGSGGRPGPRPWLTGRLLPGRGPRRHGPDRGRAPVAGHGRGRVVDELAGGPVGRSPVPTRRTPRWGPAGGGTVDGGWIHSPVKDGLRFSKKARIASWRSLVEKTSDWCRDSCSRTSSNGRENESLMARFMNAIAMGGPAASFAASAATAPSSSPAGTTRLAIPIS